MKYNEDIINYVKKNKLDEVIAFQSQRDDEDLYYAVKSQDGEPFPPEWEKLKFLHEISRKRKIMSALEIGVGYSSIILAHALKLNKEDYGKDFQNKIRRENPFHVFSVDDSEHFVNECQNRIKEELKDYITFSLSKNEMKEINNRICTQFEKLPNICPDLILLDGPSQFGVKNSIRGIDTATKDRVPMSGDILPIEYFLLPGTIIVVFGQTANLRFLYNNLQRNWEMQEFEDLGIATLELKEKPLGLYNQQQIELMLGQEWLKSLK